MKVFITRKLLPPGIEVLKNAGVEYEEWQEQRDLTTDELRAYCKSADALISAGPNKIDKAFLEHCSHLKVVALHAVGYDNVDLDAATRLRIPIGNTPDVLSDATADTAFLLMLAVSRRAFYMHRSIAAGNWNFFDPGAHLGTELKGKTLGVFGLGKIGLEMAKRCKGAYAMKVLYHNRQPSASAAEVDATLVSFETLLATSDVVSVHSALTPETKNKFNAPAFGRMKTSSIFLNTARGGIHNEKDLIEALDNNIIWGAGLDVTNPEPMAPNNPLLSMEQACVLPHIGSATVTARNAMSRLAAENVVAGLQGRPLPHWVNPF